MPKKTTKCTYDLISVGDSTLDTFLKIEEASVLCDFDKENCWFCLSYADKIPVEQVVQATGGNSSNMAVGSSRLGLRSSFYTVLGGDDVAKKIMNSLKADGVDTRYVCFEKEKRTNYSVVLNYHAERTILIYHEHREYKLPKFPKAKWVYYSSMGKGFEVIHKDLIKYIKNNDVQLGFNPGTFQLKAGMKVIGDVLEITDVVLVNKDEAKLLLGKFNKPTVKELLRGLRHVGPNIVVITDGPKGAFVFDGKKYYHMPIYDVPVIERTGAGDSFSTGFLSAIIYGKGIEDALRWGTFNSASVIQQVGPQAGLLKKKDMMEFLKKNKKIKAKEI